MRRYIIAGIDPGATTAVAMLDLSGRKISAGSFLGGGISEATRFIERHGTPSIVACDVSPPPDAAIRLASFFSCRLYAPHKEIREDEKKRIAHGAALANNHERDAYAAAVYAYRHHANKLRQIDALPELSLEEKGRLKHLMLKGYRLKDAFLELREPESAPQAPAAQPKAASQQRSISPEELRARVSSLARENSNLRLLLERMENERQQLHGRLRLLENGVRQSMLRDSELRKLRFQLQQSLERQRPKKKEGRQKWQQKQPAPPAENDDLNRLGNPKVDLEKLVTEYRRGRKQH